MAAASTNNHRGVMTATPNEESLGFTRCTLGRQGELTTGSCGMTGLDAAWTSDPPLQSLFLFRPPGDSNAPLSYGVPFGDGNSQLDSRFVLQTGYTRLLAFLGGA